MSMMLSTLLQGLKYNLLFGNLNRKISNIEYDSRKTGDGSLFVAIRGCTTDGHRYIRDAIEKGSVAIVVDSSFAESTKDELLRINDGRAVLIVMEDTRKAIGSLSAAYFNHPEDRLDLVGVTGTKGKTTTTFMINDILRLSGRDTGLIGTVCTMIGDEKIHTGHTTPESHEIYELLEMMAKKQFDSCVMEVSSTGMKFDRVYGLRYDIGCFTNLYEDHIGGDEHADMEEYLNCKLALFNQSRTAVINRDCDVADRVIEYASGRCPVYTYGMSPDCDCRAYDIRKTRKNGVTGTTFMISSPWYEGEIFMSLPGKFNVYNALCAICTAGLLKIDFEAVRGALSRVFVPGRVQPVQNKLNISVLVDYAHNASSLQSVITTVREYTEGRVITVFGCGGERSATRRYEMGEVSGNYSDYTVITSDNPRSENPQKILDNIVEGIRRTDGKYEVIEDRAQAIEKAIRLAEDGDTVLIAGKGHEDYQIFADRTIHFDDVEVASEIVSHLEAERNL